MRAIPPVAADMPVNPRTPATTDIKRKMRANLSMCVLRKIVGPCGRTYAGRNAKLAQKVPRGVFCFGRRARHQFGARKMSAARPAKSISPASLFERNKRNARAPFPGLIRIACQPRCSAKRTRPPCAGKPARAARSATSMQMTASA